jgi:hypothetical protein
MQAYDLIVIGSGPGGQRAAIQAAKSGKRVAIIEKGAALGGVCSNTGTIPSKTMREAVLHLSGFYYQNLYGANYRLQDVVTRVFNYPTLAECYKAPAFNGLNRVNRAVPRRSNRGSSRAQRAIPAAIGHCSRSRSQDTMERSGGVFLC